MEDNNELIQETALTSDSAAQAAEPKEETERPAAEGEEPKEQPEARGAEKKPGAKKRRTLKLLIVLATVAVLAALAVVWIVPAASYAIGDDRFEKGDYAGAYRAFHLAGNYRNANKRAGISKRANAYRLGEEAFDAGDYAAALEYYTEAGDHPGADRKRESAERGVRYTEAQALIAEGRYAEAIEKLAAAGSFPGVRAAKDEAYGLLGDKLFGEGGYVEAAEAYAAIGSAEGVLECGKALIAEGKYPEAAEALALVDDESVAPWRQYALYFTMAEEGDREGAVAALTAAGDLPEAAAELPHAYYELGEQLIGEGSYAEAEKAFAKAGDYSDAAEKVTLSVFLKAEDYYSKGYLNSAKAAYESLPSDYGRDGVTVKDRLATLDRYKAYLAICGEWGASYDKNRIETRETYSSGYYYYWYQEPGSYGNTLTVTCTIRDDGKVTVSAEAKFLRYTNYDDDYYDLKTDTASYTFKKDVSSPAATLGSDSKTLNYVGGKFKMHYQVKDQSKTYATYTYTCDYVYDRRTKAY